MPLSPGQRFLRLFLLGMVGIASLPFTLMPMLQSYAIPADASRFSIFGLVLLSLVQPTILLGVGVSIGVFAAQRVGLHSLTAQWERGGPSVFAQLRMAAPLAVALGFAVAIVTLALDLGFFKPRLPEFFEHVATIQPYAVETTLSGMLYGGITEELIVRWGIMSLLVWLAWRLFRRDEEKPHATLVWVGIVLSAMIFGLLHVPSARLVAPLTALSVSRIILLNGIGGIVFGWLFWKRSLEAAMMAHASVHVFLFLAVLAGLG